MTVWHDQVDAESYPQGRIRWKEFPRLGWKLKIVTDDGWYQINAYRSPAKPERHLGLLALILRRKVTGRWQVRLHRFYDEPSAFVRAFGQPFVEGGHTEPDWEARKIGFAKEREVAEVRKRVIAYGIKHGHLPADYKDHRIWGIQD